MAKGPKGLDRLMRQIKALPELQRQAAANSLQQGAEELAEAVRRAVPAKRTGRLYRSVRAEQGGLDQAGVSEVTHARSRAKAEHGLAWRVVAGGPQAPHARWVEHGTAYAPAGNSKDAKGKTRNNKREHKATRAQPYFWPTIRALKKRAKSRVIRNANKAAKAAAAVK